MFGESESESPRVPSPWDSLISTTPIVPQLVPENDNGNVEYKLQLLSPSPARFARLVTQLKWRLLEGGGQAYYELGVADSGALVGLPRAELEQTLETLEMMAGEIGASVIVVKEIEVPAVIAGIAASHTDTWNGQRKQRAPRPGSSLDSESSVGTLTNTSIPTTETETEPSTASEIDDGDFEDMSSTIVIERTKVKRHLLTHSSAPIAVFAMEADFDPDPANNADVEPDDDPILSPPPPISIDLEISSVFKPRPVRTRFQSQNAIHPTPSKSKRLKKIKHITDHANIRSTVTFNSSSNGNANTKTKPVDPANKALDRRAMRDRKREDKRKALLSAVTSSNAVSDSPSCALPDNRLARDLSVEENTSNALVADLAALHVSIDESALQSCVIHQLPGVPPTIDTNPLLQLLPGDEVNDDDDADLFPSGSRPQVTTAFKTGIALAERSEESQTHTQNRLIVEALVVRKMSLDEAFLDFEGFG